MAEKISKIKKRSGDIVNFNRKKITEAILRASEAVGVLDEELPERLTEQVISKLNEKFYYRSIPAVEEVQDMVEETLIENKCIKIAKKYILYRDQRARLRDMKGMINSNELIEGYLQQTDWRVKENSNMDFSLQGLNNHLSSAISSNYWLNKVYTSNIRSAHKEGDIHIHDLQLIAPYCAGWDLKDLLLVGFRGVSGKIESKPPKHFRVALGQAINFLYTLQGEVAGAEAFANVDTYLAPFIRYDELSYKQVKQGLQEFLYNINIPTRVGFQTPFTNITLDLSPPKTLGKENIIIGGEVQKEKYKDFQKEMDMFNYALAELMIEGDSKGRVFTFPIPTYNITKNFSWDSQVAEKIFEMTSKYGIPYFCLDEDTEVVTFQGIKKMKELSSSDYLLTEEGDYKQIKFKKKIHSQENIILKAEDFQVVCSPNHRFPTKQGIKKAKELNLNDHLKRYKEKNIKEIPLTKIEKEHTSRVLYDITITSSSHLFVLKNGIISHNSNFINSDMDPDDVRSMCCRLKIDNRELRKRGGGLFGANPLTGCYDEKTEILTTDGWKNFRDLTLNDQVFTLAKDNKIEVHKPVRLFAYNWDGNLYRFKTRSLDLLVTPNHKMVVDDIKTGKRKLVKAEDFDVNNQRIPKQGTWLGKEVKFFVLPSIENNWVAGNHQSHLHYKKKGLKIFMNDWLKFLGIWLSEGSFDNDKNAYSHGYRVFITQIKKETKKTIKNLLENLPFHYKETNNGFVITNKQLWSYLKQFGHCYDKFIPKEIKKLSKNQLQILFDWLIEGDGHLRSLRGVATKRQITYYTASKHLADDVQEIVMKLGWLATLTRRKGRKSSTKGREIISNYQYVVGIQQSTHYRLRKENIILEQYKGKVYSCEVPNHTLFVRRNGKVSWSGNSIGVVTINLPKIGYLSKTKEELYSRLFDMMNIAEESLETKRDVLEKLTENGLYPYSKYYLRTINERFGKYWQNHFSTIGIIGMNELLLNFIGEDITSVQGKELATEIMEFMRERLMDYQNKTDNLYNLEATPAEGTSRSLAKKDKDKYSDIIVANNQAVKEGTGTPYYTNSSQLPVYYTEDLFEALDLQDDLQIKYTGGTVFHTFIGEALPSAEAAKKLIYKIAHNYQLPYFTLSPTFSICPVHGYLAGEHYYCPKCDEELHSKQNKNEQDGKNSLEYE